MVRARRVCSLLPSATEIVFALGQSAQLVGVSHECDYPAQALELPHVTRSLIPAGLSGAEIDAAVTQNLNQSGSLYELDLALLEELQPDLILTQRLCDVCAVSFDRVQEAAENISSHPQLINLEPHSLQQILQNIVEVGEALGCPGAALELTELLWRRIEKVRDTAASVRTRPRVFCMEWVNPPYCGGHWMKELVEIAGGHDELANFHRPSTRIDWMRVLDFAPEIVVLSCCGYSLRRCLEEAGILQAYDGYAGIPAVRAGRVYATDGSAYFSRPGPRIVESLEILAYLIHPELFPAPRLEGAFQGVPQHELRRS